MAKFDHKMSAFFSCDDAEEGAAVSLVIEAWLIQMELDYEFLLRLLSSNLLVHLGINKKMKIFGNAQHTYYAEIIRQLLRLRFAGCLIIIIISFLTITKHRYAD